jgi:Protein of unknown function (DUF3300)
MKKGISVNIATLVVGSLALALIAALPGSRLTVRAEQQSSTAAKKPAAAPSAAEIDRLLAPIALYPDPLLAQILMCAGDPAKVKELNAWLKKNTALKGTPLQDAAVKAGFEPSFVALVLFSDIVNMMAVQQDWTTGLGQAFAADRSAVFGSIQRLRAQAQKAGNLKDTPQQEVETKTTSAGEQVIVIEPSNPQVVYVPQYNSTTVYVQQESSSSTADAAVAGIIGFTAGIAIGAAIDNDYYYGPYGWRGGGYMYNDAWDDYYDHREDAREDWMDHREDLSEERTDRRENTAEQRTERQENRPEATQAQKDQARSKVEQNRSSTSTGTQSTSSKTRTSSGSYESRGRSTDTASARERSGTRSDAFSGYSSGKSTQAASSRGQRSRSGGGGGRRR